MIARYTRPEMGRIWSDANKYQCWLAVEIAASQALAKFGLVPQSAADAIRDRGAFTVDRINEIEAEVRHDVIAFTTTVAEHINSPEDSRWLHYGLTSTDVVDTAQALQLKEASAIIRAGIVALSETLKKRAIEFKHTPIIGRTHGIHAEPSTFGLKLLLWYSEMQRNLTRFDAAAEDLRVGKLSGAVGTFGHLKPEHEEAICAELGLRPVAVATQVVQRDRHAAYVATLAVLASTLDKIATEIRHLQRTEVREAEEFFSEKQKGSSAMPHKRNPITSEQISGLARVIRANAQVAFENVALWHERDISHSSAERVILPDSTILADYLLAKTEQLINKLLVYPARMLKNLESTGGLIFSGQLLLDLAESGMSREDAYRLVQTHAMNSWKNDLIFRDEIAKVPEITARLTPEKLARAFDYHRQLANVDAIFARVLGTTH
jgi:adenylosuccinate lyase